MLPCMLAPSFSCFACVRVLRLKRIHRSYVVRGSLGSYLLFTFSIRISFIAISAIIFDRTDAKQELTQ